ncbi:hypothetical protein KM043_000560 [Ampulex compressa]|nr:hypothetical protein KM043_000560 [Ampulex compressa]
MREKSAECHAHAGHVRGTTEMCSRDPPTLHPTLAKANGKNSSPQPVHRTEARIDEMEKELRGFPFQRKPFGHQLAQLQIGRRVRLLSAFPTTILRNPRNPLCAHPRLIARKRRRPLDPAVLLLVPESVTSYSRPARKLNGASSGKVLSLIIDKLARLLDPNVVSPRKRILRELERVSLEDQASKRRATPQPVCTANVPTTSPKQLSSVRMEPYIGTTNPPVHHPLYGVPMLPPGPYRAPLWMHYPSPVHYPPPMPLYAPPPPHPPSPPVHHYKDYREQALTPPSDMPLNLSKHAG